MAAASNGEETPSSSMAPTALPIAAKLMVATDRGECERLKDIVSKEDTTTMVVALGSSREASAAAMALKNAAAEERASSSTGAMDAKVLIATSPSDCESLKDTLSVEDAAAMLVVMTSRKDVATKPSMNPLLLSLASRGECATLDQILNMLGVPAPPQGLEPTLPTQQATGALASAEPGMDLNGVTIEGDTALHVVATCGEDRFYLKCAKNIYNKAKHLLFAENNKGDTPLHCAVRAGNAEMVSCLIGLAKSEDNSGSSSRLKEFLRKENCSKETALHEAVRVGNKNIITKLFEFDSELARYPRDGTGTSPLYLAVLLERVDIARKLHELSKGRLSYSGPNRQNALHAAVLQGKEMTEMLLNWNTDLTKQADQNGSTPLHFAASLFWGGNLKQWKSKTPLIHVLKANPIQLYQPDSEGFYPIHVAASSGAKTAFTYFIKERPEIAGFRDSKGRTFLHVAAESNTWDIVAYTCSTPSLAWILNLQDNDGNTAMHNIDKLILRALMICNASYGNLRVDHLKEQVLRQRKKLDKVRESEKLTDSTQTLGIGSVLIVTVTFGALFAIPGGYKADDHYNGGTPTLARRYIFDAFIMADTIAFICSVLATINLMYSGMAMVSLALRYWHFNTSLFLAYSSVTSLGAAFTLGMYLVLAPVARWTAIAICVMMMIASTCLFTEPLNAFRVAIALYVRKGNRVLPVIARVLLFRTLITYWPCAVIFGWAAISTKYGHGRHG
ncbi:hypothetical protein OsI_33465 [Oryza sativa Indica Group]|uniref:PGG domain-containing protein n=1 Tax=Oryza sativa subsp. indica TaxID=39946 RepID=A2Z6Z4_ORYSI|nr:hypothetical protein OsI_33465 [Oryza sativa Indica Group]